MRYRNLLTIAAAVALMTLGTSRADAFTVTNLEDSGPGSLRQAILDANATPALDEVVFESGLTGTITLTSGTLIIAGPLLIQGPGSGVIAVSGNNAFRVFTVSPGAAVQIHRLSIIHGRALTAGGGIFNSGTMGVLDCTLSGNGAIGGGGVFNDGMMSLVRCNVSDNSARFSGGISNVGSLYVKLCTVSGNRAEQSSGGIGVSITATQHGSATLEDSVIAGNSAGTEGGGILNLSPRSLTLTRCTIAANTALGDGGGISNRGRRLTLTECALSGNQAGVDGGAIFTGPTLLDPASAALTSCTMANNAAGASGGGISNSGQLSVSRCMLSANSAGSGGGISNRAGLSVSDSTLFANSAADTGGGLENDSGAASLQRCTVAGNGAISGGGIFNRADLTVQSCTINGNIANGGGGLYNLSPLPIDSGDPAPPAAILTIGNSTVSGNRAFLGGGLINYANVLMTSCTLFGNRADAGGGIRQFSGGRIKVGNTLVANSGAGGNYQGDEASSLTSFGGNLDSDGTCGLAAPTDQRGRPDAPLDPKLGPLQNNGGPTATHALAPDSPAVDGGDPALTPGSTDPTDQRGFERIADGDRNGTTIIDIGAFELSYFGTRGLHVRPEEAFLAFSTVQSQNTDLPAGTEGLNLTIHYSAGIAPDTLVAMLNGDSITHLFNPNTPEGFETVAIPLRTGPNRLILRVKGTRDGRPAQDVDNLGFRVGDPPFGPQ